MSEARRTPRVALARALAHVRAAVGDAFRVPDPAGDGAVRFVRLAHRLRLTLGLVVLAAVPFLGSLSSGRRTVLVTLVGLLYLPYAVLLARFSRGRELAGLRLAVVADSGLLFLFALLIPDTRVVVLFADLLVAAFYAFLGGMTTGLVVAAAGTALVAVAEAVTVDQVVDGHTLVMFLAVAAVLVVLIESATGERRRAISFLSRLQAAIAEVPAAPDLDHTLHSVARAALDATGAKFVSVLVRDAAGVNQGALEGDIGIDLPERSSEMIVEILRDPESSPSGIVLTTGQRVVVPSVADDPRFARWIGEAEHQGFTSTVAVPLRARDDVIGVLAAYFRSPDGTTSDNVELLAAYAEFESLVILRALAYEHERRAATRLAEADAIKSDLVATVSHELRTPLTAVKGFVETVLRHWERFDDTRRRELLERALHNADQLSALVNRVLDFSRLEAGAVRVQPAELDLEAELTRIVEDHATLLAGHPVRLGVTPGIRAEGDREGVEHVLDNLLANAAKYSPADSPITVTATVVNDEVVIAVHDEGIGISEVDLPRIFDRFFRATPGAGPRGTGIGLSIVKRYAELMGARVWATSEPGKGSTFSVGLPLATRRSHASA